MSWGVNDSGTAAEVKVGIAKQFEGPLAEGARGLTDAGEKETVRMVRDMIVQCLGTFDPDKKVFVSANGHLDTVGGRSQQVNIVIR